MAAGPPHSPRHSKHSDCVVQDMIWKAHVKKEEETTKMWPENWGFLTAQYSEPRTETIMEAEEAKREIKVPNRMKIRAVTPVEQHIKVDPSPAFPKTTQGLIGWRSAVPALTLERYGRPQHLKGNFCKSMKWPAEGVA